MLLAMLSRYLLLVLQVVSDHTWVQHRCMVTGVEAIKAPPEPRSQPSCSWSPKLAGHSPGSSLRQLQTADYAHCQQACCAALPGCQAIIFAEGGSTCFLLDRKYEGNFAPATGVYVADLNCTHGVPLACAPPPPPPVMRTRVNISSECFQLATASGPLGMKLSSVSFWENTGRPQHVGEWYFDARAGKFYVWPLPAAVIRGATITASVAIRETLVAIEGASDITWANITFTHAAWFRAASPEGFVERYGGVLFQAKGAAAGALIPSHAAVMVRSSNNIHIHGCTFAALGAWGIRLYDGSQQCSVERSTFAELSGGGICLGNVNDSAVVDPRRQMAHITVADNTLTDVRAQFMVVLTLTQTDLHLRVTSHRENYRLLPPNRFIRFFSRGA